MTDLPWLAQHITSRSRTPNRPASPGDAVDVGGAGPSGVGRELDAELQERGRGVGGNGDGDGVPRVRGERRRRAPAAGPRPGAGGALLHEGLDRRDGAAGGKPNPEADGLAGAENGARAALHEQLAVGERVVLIRALSSRAGAEQERDHASVCELRHVCGAICEEVLGAVVLVAGARASVVVDVAMVRVAERDLPQDPA